MKVPRRAAKRDGNEREIIDALRGVGASVEQWDTVDLVVGYRGKTYLIEVKEGNAKLRESQEEFAQNWRGHLDIARNVDDALSIIGAFQSEMRFG